MQNIKPGTGLDDILFGIKPDELEQILGKPSGYEPSDNEDGLTMIHYDDLNLSFGFSDVFGNRLLSIITNNENAKIDDITLIGDSMQDVLDKLEVLGITDIDIEDISNDEFPNQQLLTVFEYSLNFWFDNDELAEIQWGPFWEYEKDKPVWPKHNDQH